MFVGITRDGLSKRRATGGVRVQMRKKRKFLLGRPAAMTRIGPKRVHPVRVRGGNIKVNLSLLSVSFFFFIFFLFILNLCFLKSRAIRLETGSFSWGSEAISKKARIIEVVYNASSNELVRTNTLVKGAIVNVEAAPFIDWYKGYYGVALAKDTKGAEAPAAAPAKAKKEKAGKKKPVAKKSPTDATDAERAERAKDQVLDPEVAEQLKLGRVLARITSRPGQTGVADGYILEGEELRFYRRKLQKKK